jgi:hypothetical protein
MDDQRDQRRINWSSLIGWVIFLCILLLGPLSGLLRRVFSGGLPRGWLPYILGGLAIIVIAVAAVRTFGRTSTPQPPQWPAGTMSPSTMRPPIPPGGGSYQPTPPRFDPLISPRLLTAGIVGLVVIVGGWLVLIFAGIP